MLTSPHKRGYSNRPILDGDARAVIEAEFKEITTRTRYPSVAHAVRNGLQWIKHRLQRT